MTIMNTQDNFGVVAKLLHWIIGVMIITLLCVGFYMTDLVNSAEKFQIYAIHKSFGTIVLDLVVLRMIWRFLNRSPMLPDTVPYLHKIGYKINIFFMYLCMLTMPISGILMTLYFGMDVMVFNIHVIDHFAANENIAHIFRMIHSYTAILFSLIILGHIAFALYHHFIKKDSLLVRIIKNV